MVNKALISNQMPPETRLKRLIYRSCHRGCKETDIVLGGFAESKLMGLSPEYIDIYEHLLDEDDADIWSWLIGKTGAPGKYGVLLEMMKEGGY